MHLNSSSNSKINDSLKQFIDCTDTTCRLLALITHVSYFIIVSYNKQMHKKGILNLKIK